MHIAQNADEQSRSDDARYAPPMNRVGDPEAGHATIADMYRLAVTGNSECYGTSGVQTLNVAEAT